MAHLPVMRDEVLTLLEPCTIRAIFDGTCGAGGHAQAVLQAHPEIERYFACDQDTQALDMARAALALFGSKVTFHHSNFSAPPADALSLDGILLDLGVSSMQLDTPERGFSFMREGPLDMRMDTESELTADEIVNRWDRMSLERLFQEYGEERGARKAAEAIVRARSRRPFTTTIELADALARVLPRRGKAHPATKIFQAIRIAVNRELELLKMAIPLLAQRLAPNGRFLIITFHSLEDRIVKEGFRHLVQTNDFSVVVKKPLVPSRKEIYHNPRARSAKLRAIVKGGSL
jgi:16S rRNA (cytosine1402-N4)-methyltransferase